MWKTAAFIACGVLGGWAHAQPAEGTADDDLAMVKRAVEKGGSRGPSSTPPAPAVRRPHRLDQARWFRIRIEENKGTKVKVNLPLGVVRSLGDDMPVDWGCRGSRRPCRTFKLSEVLDLLEAGEHLVEIKDLQSTIRIWVD